MKPLYLRLSLLLILSVCLNPSSAQTKIKFSEPYETSSGIILNPDDTLIFGFPSDTFRKAFRYVYISNNEKLFTSAATNRKAVIKHFRRETIDGKEVIIAVIPPQPEVALFNVHIEIDKALESGEIFSTKSQFIGSKGNWFDNEPLLYFIKVFEKDPQNYAREFLYRYNRETFTRYKDDEFEINKIVNSTILDMEKSIDSLSFTTTYTVGIKLDLNEYDFSRRAFPFLLTEAVTVLDATWNTHALSKVYMVITNAKLFTGLEMNEDRAKNFIQKRKDRYGNVDRTVYAKVNFVLDDKVSSFQATDGSTKEALTAKATSLEFYGNKNFVSDDLGIVAVTEK